MKECFRNSKSIVDFYVDTLLSKNLNPKDLTIEIRKKVLPYIAQMKDKTDQAQWVKVIMKKTFINEEALWEDLKKVGTADSGYDPGPNSSPPSRRVDTIERKILGIIVWKRENKDKENILERVDVEGRVREIIGDRLDELEKIFEKDKELLLFETESHYNYKHNNKNNLEKDIDEEKELATRLH